MAYGQPWTQKQHGLTIDPATGVGHTGGPAPRGLNPGIPTPLPPPTYVGVGPDGQFIFNPPGVTPGQAARNKSRGGDPTIPRVPEFGKYAREQEPLTALLAWLQSHGGAAFPPGLQRLLEGNVGRLQMLATDRAITEAEGKDLSELPQYPFQSYLGSTDPFTVLASLMRMLDANNQWGLQERPVMRLPTRRPRY